MFNLVDITWVDSEAYTIESNLGHWQVDQAIQDNLYDRSLSNSLTLC